MTPPLDDREEIARNETEGRLVDDNGLEALCQGNFRNLQTLSLSFPSIGEQGVLALARADFPALRKFYISAEVKGAHMVHLADASWLKTVVLLSFGSFMFDFDDFIAFMTNLKAPLVNVKTLYFPFSHACITTHEDVKRFLRAGHGKLPNVDICRWYYSLWGSTPAKITAQDLSCLRGTCNCPLARDAGLSTLQKA